MPHISVTVLGAGGEVGRSCFLVRFGLDCVLVDTGVHLTPSAPVERIPSIPSDCQLAAIIVTHYHLDHVGALPYLLGVSNSTSLSLCNVFMTTPTSLLAPPVLMDYCRNGPNSDLYTPNHVMRCFEKVRTLPLNTETFLTKDRRLSVTAFHSGHVLGGVGLLFKDSVSSLVYTGDFSVLQDALLRPLQVPHLSIPNAGVDVIISEATHATRIAERPISASEKELCTRIASTLNRNGKVLIPIFAVGRTQEIASIIRHHLGYEPELYTTSVSGRKASIITQSVARSWNVCRDNTQVEDLNVKFLNDVKNIPSGACVIFSSPAMIEGGTSLDIFLIMCENPNNLVVLTGYCSKDTVGNSVILFASRRGSSREIVVHGKSVKVQCECAYVPFSNHSDSPGIESVIRRFVPRNAILVHGDKMKMETLSKKVNQTWAGNVNISIPDNGAIIAYDSSDRSTVPPDRSRPVTIRRKIVTRCVDYEQVLDCILKSGSDFETSTIGDRLIIRREGRSVWLSMRPHSPEVILEYFSDARDRPAEWVTHNQLVMKVKKALSSICVDDFSISECSQ